MISSGIDHCMGFFLCACVTRMRFQNRSFRHTCHARNEQKLEETNELMKVVLLSSSPVHFNTSKYFS